MHINTIKKTFLALLLLATAIPLYAQNSNIQRARVLEVIKEEKNIILEEFNKGGIDSLNQTLFTEIIDGPEKGKKVELENDYIRLKKNDVFFIEKGDLDGADIYSVKERDRQIPILLLFLIFGIIIVIFSGKQGLRSILSLTGSFLVIGYVLLPLLIKGYSPMIVSIVVAAIILFFAIYFTHGFNRESSVAFSGTIISVVLTGILAVFSVWLMNLTGFDSDEATYLQVSSAIKLNFHGLLLGGILIGVLGILDDIAVTQAAVVSEIYQSASHLRPIEVYKKAMRVGREHVSALVNTLVLAYAGASLPLLLLFSSSEYSWSLIISSELFSTEIVRTMVGSIGLVLTVPITTLLAVHFLKGYKGKSALGHHGHSH